VTPALFSQGRRAWDAGEIVLRNVDDEAEATWVAEFVGGVAQRGFRLAQPIRARDGRWVVDGWTAWTRVPGAHSTTRWPELLTAAHALHEAIRNVARPEFITRLTNRWRLADGIAWGEVAADEVAAVAHLDRLLAARRPVDLPSQLVHGDLVGNVLFADGLPPAIIDLSLYWRPVGYGAALVVGDAIAWEGAPTDLSRELAKYDEWPQLLLRAVIFRVVVSELARRAEPWRKDVSAQYRAIVDLALSFINT